MATPFVVRGGSPSTLRGGDTLRNDDADAPEANPPFSRVALLGIVATCWTAAEPPPPEPPRPKVAAVLTVNGDNPPFGVRIPIFGPSLTRPIYGAHDEQYGWITRGVRPDSGAAVGPPRKTWERFYGLLNTWLDPDPQPQQRRLNAAIFEQVVVAEKVPYARREITWPPEEASSQRLKPIAPLTLIYGDQPPRSSRAALYGILVHWIPPDPQPWQLVHWYVPPAAADVVPPAASRLPIILADHWRDPPWGSQRRPPIAPLTLTYGDQPPRLTRQPLPAPEEPYQLPRRPVGAAAFAVVADKVPFARVDVVGMTWPQPDREAQRTRLAPIPAQGDQPPRFSWAKFFGVLSLWIPPDPEPRQLPRLLLQASPISAATSTYNASFDGALSLSAAFSGIGDYNASYDGTMSLDAEL